MDEAQLVPIGHEGALFGGSEYGAGENERVEHAALTLTPNPLFRRARRGGFSCPVSWHNFLLPAPRGEGPGMRGAWG